MYYFELEPKDIICAWGGSILCNLMEQCFCSNMGKHTSKLVALKAAKDTKLRRYGFKQSGREERGLQEFDIVLYIKL